MRRAACIALALVATGCLGACATEERFLCGDVCDEVYVPPECDFPYTFDDTGSPVCPPSDPEVQAAGSRAAAGRFSADLAGSLADPGRVARRGRRLIGRGLVYKGDFRWRSGRGAALRRFRRGTFVSTTSFAVDAPPGSDENPLLLGPRGSDTTYALLRFRGSGGRGCLLARTRYRLRHGRVRSMRGTFRFLGGTGAAARLAGGGSFSRRDRAGAVTIRGRARASFGPRRKLPAACKRLARR
jgi:hypothetical protein